MPDRGFEQSIMQGMEDMKKGKSRRVPGGRDPVEFLRKLAERSRVCVRR